MLTRKILIAIVCLLFLNNPVLSQWNKLEGLNCGSLSVIKQVGNEIWAGGFGGLYTSTTNGLTWQKSNLIPGPCRGLESYNDTVVVLYGNILSSATEVYSISSFDNGITWQTPVFIDSPSTIFEGSICKSSKALFYKGYSPYYRSLNGGLTWNLFQNISGHQIYEIQTDGQMAIAKVAMPNGDGYYYSLNGSTNWTFLDSTLNPYKVFNNNSRIFFNVVNNNPSTSYNIMRTDDFGLTWDTCQAVMNHYMTFFMEYNGDLFMAGNTDTLVSTDNGLTWNPGSLPDYHLWRPGIDLPGGDRVGLDVYGEVFTFYSASNTSLNTNTGIAASIMNCLYSNNNILFGSTDHNIYRSSDGGLSWGVTVPDLNTNYMLFVNDTIYSIHFRNFNNSLFLRSFDNGISWDTLPIPISGSDDPAPGISEHNGRIFVSGNKMVYSDDKGMSWTVLPDLPTGIPGPCTITNNSVIGNMKSVFGKLFSLTTSGYLYDFDFNSQSWNYNFCYSSIGAWNLNEITSADGRIILYGREGFYTSSDTGQTWVQSSYSGLPFGNVPREIISINGVWFGTLKSYGVYFSNDFGDSWNALDATPPFYSHNGLCSLNNVLYAISFFDGVYRRQNPFYNITGKVFFDYNNNALQDVGESGIDNIIITSNPPTYNATSDLNGDYNLFTDINGFISPNNTSAYITVNPPSYPVSGSASNINFGYYLLPGINDLQVDLTNVNIFAPGFPTILQLTVLNSANNTASSQLELLLDSNLTFSGGSPLPDLISGDTLFWNIGPLDFLDQSNINVNVTTSNMTGIGQHIICTATIYPIINDITPANNIVLLDEVVVGSFDPNDKTCIQGDFFSTSQLFAGEELQYVIRFQNTGNIPTSFINLVDTLSLLLDPASFRKISSSHDCNWTVSGWGNLSVEFNPISLPPSVIDEAGSHGYFKYGIKCRDGVTLGNAVDNKAYIYFDFNPPIITNEVVTIIADTTSVHLFEPLISAHEILAYPNPVSDFLNIKFATLTPTGPLSLYIYDIIGKFNSRKNFNENNSIKVSELAKGMYFSIIYDENHTRLGSFRFVKY